MGMGRTRDAEAELNLPPGFRFHPTDEELVVHYLCRKIGHQCLPVPIIAEVDLYKYDPWELPEKALFGQREWYFFTPRDRKYPNGSRPNRAAGRGYWKATGADKPVLPKGSNRPAGIKKALVFYSGKAPRGAKTDWIMHEYRLADTSRGASKKGSLRLDDWVLCRLYNKKNNWKMQQPKEETSFGETVDSTFETASASQRTPDSSDMDSEIALPDFDDLGQFPTYPTQAPTMSSANAFGFQTFEQRPKEEDWFTDLNLDDLQSSNLYFGSIPSVGVDVNPELYFSSFASPVPRTNHSLHPF